MENDKFLYRHGKVEKSYFNQKEEEIKNKENNVINYQNEKQELEIKKNEIFFYGQKKGIY